MLNKVRQKYRIVAKAATFKIPAKLKAAVKIVGGLDNVEQWKAKVQVGNSGHRVKVGAWDNVGYVGFDYKTGTIVPIARCDEHHTGYDMLEELQDKKIIPRAEYQTIWALADGGNYANRDQLKELVPIVKKWLEVGGRDLTYKMWDSHHKISFSDLVANGPVIKDLRGELSKEGKQLVSLLEKAAVLYKRALSGKPVSNELLSRCVHDIAVFIDKHKMDVYLPGLQKENVAALKEASARLAKGEDIDKNMDAVFGFNGVKNSLHTMLKEIAEQKSGYKRDALSFFGDDLDFAKKELDRISAI